MRDLLQPITIFVVPTDAVSGARIVIGGDDNTIRIFNAADELTGEWGPAPFHFTVYEGSSGDFVRIIPDFTTSDGFVVPAIRWNDVILFRSVGGIALSITHATTDLGDLTIEGPSQTFQSIARGQIANATGTGNLGPFTGDGLTGIALNNVNVVANRLYLAHLHSQYTLSAAGQWRLELRANGVTVGAFGIVDRLLGTIDAWCRWLPSATGSTDDLTVFANELTGTADLDFQATADIPRNFTLYDMGI